MNSDARSVLPAAYPPVPAAPIAPTAVQDVSPAQYSVLTAAASSHRNRRSKPLSGSPAAGLSKSGVPGADPSHQASGQGYRPPAYPPVGTPLKSKMAAGLLGIFLGAFGVHNFYLGYTTKAGDPALSDFAVLRYFKLCLWHLGLYRGRHASDWKHQCGW